MCNKYAVIVMCCVLSTVASQPTNSNSEKSSIVDFILCGFENNGANCISRLINGLSNDLVVARRNLYVKADHELDLHLQARRLTVYEVHGYKPSTLMRVLESSFKGIVEMVGGVLNEIWSQPQTTITSRQFGGGDQEYESSSYMEMRGKKKKRQNRLPKGMVNVFMILSIVKAKVDLICKIISTQLQIQFAIIATIGLILNIARFWLDYRQPRGPPPYSPPPPSQLYNNDQQNANYDDTNKQPGYYPRSINKRTAYQEQEDEAQALAYSAYYT